MMLAGANAGRFAWALSAEEIALLNRPDRQKILEEGARKEGKLV